MGFSEDEGYVPVEIADLMLSVMNNVNTQFGTSYTADTFIGTNFYKFYYALVQRLHESEVKTSEIFLKLQQYFEITNELISRPVVTNPGIIEALGAAGYTASVKPIEDADAGKVFVCVDVDDSDPGYAATKLAINNLIKDFTVAGTVSQGSESSSIVLSNGQSFDFKFSLPNITELYLKLTITLSENNQVAIDSTDDIKARLISNINDRYRLGKNFEPQRYWNIADDSPWAGSVLLEWSDDAGMSYQATVIDADFDDLFTYPLAHITLIEA